MTKWNDTLIIIVLSVVCFGQSIPPEQAIRGKRWDATHGTLFFGLGPVDRTSRPIRSYQGDFQTTGEVEILKDFPRAQKAFVIDATAGPESSTILSVVLDFGSKLLRHVILTYDSAGVLRSVLDTAPFISFAITADENGNVFALGDKLLGQETDDKPYPLLREYDAGGALIGQFLYSSSFHQGRRAVGPGNGRDAIYPVLSLHGRELYIYAPVETEFLICTTSGAVVRREPLDKIRAKIAAADKVEFAGIHQVAFIDESHLVIDLEEYPSGPQLMMPAKTYLLNLDTQQYKPAAFPPGEQFVGVKDHQLVVLSPSPDKHPLLKTYNIPGD
jgi:hypothetical protein